MDCGRRSVGKLSWPEANVRGWVWNKTTSDYVLFGEGSDELLLGLAMVDGQVPLSCTHISLSKDINW